MKIDIWAAVDQARHEKYGCDVIFSMPENGITFSLYADRNKVSMSTACRELRAIAAREGWEKKLLRKPHSRTPPEVVFLVTPAGKIKGDANPQKRRVDVRLGR
jgi:hypothetical protein